MLLEYTAKSKKELILLFWLAGLNAINGDDTKIVLNNPSKTTYKIYSDRVVDKHYHQLYPETLDKRLLRYLIEKGKYSLSMEIRRTIGHIRKTPVEVFEFL